jgi:hypothetical protein
MAVTNTDILFGAQVKIEGARGTPETTMTRWLYPTVGQFSWTYAQDHDDLSESNRTFHGKSAFSLSRYQVSFTYQERVSFEDLVWWLNTALDGNNRTGTTTGSTPAGFTYTLTPQASTDDLDTFTMKFNDAGNTYKIDRCVVNRLTLNWDSSPGTSQPSWLMTAEILGRTLTPAATYDAIADRSRTIIKSIGTALYIDEPGGTLGTTQKLGYLRSGEIVIDNQIELKAFSEDPATSAVDFGRGEQLITGSVVMEFKDDAEFAKMRAGTSRKLRILNTGAVIGSTPTTNYKAQFDFGVAQWMPPTMGYAGHNSIQTFGFVAYKSATVTVPITVAVVNASTTITA